MRLTRDCCEKAEPLVEVDLGKDFAEYASSEITSKSSTFDPDSFGVVLSALSMELPLLLEQASQLHGLLQRWTEKSAELESNYMLLKAAAEARFGNCLLDARRTLSGTKATKDVIDARARNDPGYRTLQQETILAYREFMKAKGVVSALFTKRDMAKAMLYVMGGEQRVASQTFTTDGGGF